MYAIYFLVFLFQFVSLIGVSAQDILQDAEQLYHTLTKKDYINAQLLLDSSKKNNIEPLLLYKQTRERAKKNNDCEATQFLTKKIESQKLLWVQRHPLLLIGIAVSVTFVVTSSLSYPLTKNYWRNKFENGELW